MKIGTKIEVVDGPHHGRKAKVVDMRVSNLMGLGDPITFVKFNWCDDDESFEMSTSMLAKESETGWVYNEEN